MKIDNLASDSEDFTGNVWLIDGSENVLIDAGEGECWQRIRELESISKVVLTHSHHDHISNLGKIVEKFDPEIYCYEPENISSEAEQISEGDSIELSGEEFEVFHTPGHKDDSICLYNDKGVLFTGDLIFPDGEFGRTDLAEGDRDQLIKSIEKIVDLDVGEFYSGHGNAVTSEAGKWIEKSLENAKKHKPKY